MAFTPRFLTTVVGSFPHSDGVALCQRLAEVLDIPAWPQLPRRTFRESMYVQYSTRMPGLVLDEANERVTFDTSGDLTPTLEAFYNRYLDQAVDSFALDPACAAGFYAMLDTLRSTSGEWAKGQITGPVTLGLKVTDQNLRASLYDDVLLDVIVKGLVMGARWQVRQLRAVRPNVILFVDEPYMASFGSAFISLQREQVIALLDEVFAAIHAEGALAGVHCCANTDWSVLLGTEADILNLDAYGYLENLALYPAEVRAFLDRGGVVAWGIVPNNEEVNGVSPAQLADRLWAGLDTIASKAQARGITLTADELASRSLITPACGLGSTTVDIAERVLDVLAQTSDLLDQG